MAARLDELRARIERLGPRPFGEFVEAALYDGDGFYEGGGGRAGRREGDFLTSPEVGPLFGAVVARALDRWWEGMGRPDPYVVVEAGAGPGTLARTVLAAAPACAPALRYVLVERSAAQRRRHAEHLPVVRADHAFAPAADDDEDRPPAGAGPLVVSMDGFPRQAGPCVVIANELLDNLPFDLWEVRGGTWMEVRVGAGGAGLEEVVAPGDPPRALPEPVGLPEGARAPVQAGAARWLREAIDDAHLAEGGRVVVFDYCATTSDLARRPWSEWLRTYRGHGRGTHPLEDPGEQDVTAEVCLDQLASIRRPATVATQAEWLRAHGIDALVEEGRRVWEERASVGDLAALRMRSRVREAEALLDPGGLGAFDVAEWCAQPAEGSSDQVAHVRDRATRSD